MNQQIRIIDQIRDSIFTLDDNRIVQNWNKGSQLVFGYPASEIVGKHVSQICTDNSKKILKQTLDIVFSKDDKVEIELKLKKNNGDLFDAEISLSTYVEEDGQKYFILRIADISSKKAIDKKFENHQKELGNLVKSRTSELQQSLIQLRKENEERIKAQQSLQMAKDEAERANNLKTEFLSRMSHELRTPLNAILGFGQLLLINDPGEKNLEFANEIVSAGDHLLSLIDEVLDLSLIESDKIKMKIRDASLFEIIQESVSLIQNIALENNIEIKNEVNENNSVSIKVDRTRFKEVITNLLTNAIKYNHTGSSVTVRHEILSGKKVRVYVEDKGVGISQKNQKNIFEPFNRLGQEFSEINGVGVGLSISKKMIELMNGSIGVSSELGSGSRFWVDCIINPNNVTSINSSRFHSATLSLDNKKRVLYVEDNPANLRLVQHLVERLPDIQLISAVTWDEGLVIAKNMKPDLIVLDIDLPGINGYEVLKRIRTIEQTKDIVVVALSESSGAKDVEDGIRAGFDRYLTKPIDGLHFVNTLNEELEGIQNKSKIVNG